MSQQIVGIHDAKSNLSKLVQRAAAGETILLGPHGRAEAKLIAVDAPARARRQLGLMKGKLVVPADFDAELPREVEDSFGAGA